MSEKYKNSRKKAGLNRIIRQSQALDKSKEHITFNFEYFTYSEKGGQSFEEWQADKILADLNNKLKDFSGSTCQELMNDNRLELFDSYPQDSRFEKPKCFIGKPMAKWARLRLTGRQRLIGVFLNDMDNEEKRNVFYVVFLDKNHDFALWHKKNT